MKHLRFLGILAIGLLFTNAPAFADQFSDGGWHSVLVCDNGAAVVDNALAIGRGGTGAQAQIVVRDQNIISYFNQSGAVQSAYGATEWIGKSYPTMQNAGNLLSFQLSTVSGTVSFDGTGLRVDLGLANWYFRNCVRK